MVTRKLDGLIDAIAEGLRGPGQEQKLHDREARKAALEQSVAAALPTAPRIVKERNWRHGCHGLPVEPHAASVGACQWSMDWALKMRRVGREKGEEMTLNVFWTAPRIEPACPR